MITKYKFLYGAFATLMLLAVLAVPGWATAPVFSGDTGQPVAVYTLTNSWLSSNRDELSLQNDFGLVKADAMNMGYDVRATADLSTGIPNTTKIIILPGNGVGLLQQILDVNAAAAQTNLQAFVQGGGCLLGNLADGRNGDGYLIPGMLGKADDATGCTGTTITAAGLGHPITFGPDGLVGGGDDLTQDSVDAQKQGSFGGSNFCNDNEGSLAGILPGSATVIWTEEGGAQRPTLAEYSLGSGRVVVHTRPIEFSADGPQVMINVLDNILDFQGCNITQVDIDIKPGSDPNSINLGSKGVIPVAILTMDTFDAADVDQSTLTLEGASAKAKGKSGNIGSLIDIDGDGELDLLVHFPTADLNLINTDTSATLSGETLDGMQITGTDSVNIVPK